MVDTTDNSLNPAVAGTSVTVGVDEISGPSLIKSDDQTEEEHELLLFLTENIYNI